MAEARAVSSLGGYDEKFVNAVDDDLHCAICQLPLKDPILTKCGHRFCRQCLDEHFRSLELNRQPLSCPVDRNNLKRDNEHTFPDKATERKILSFIIRCSSEGCQWTGELRSKDNHISSCLLKVVSCTNKNCLVTLTRNKLQKHVTATCPWRIIRCTHCPASHPECKTGVHQNVCRRFPLNCPKSCGAIIPREEISTHNENDCPLTIISCPYAQMGCAIKIQRREIETHLQTAVRVHLDLACVKLNATQVQLKNTQDQLTNMYTRQEFQVMTERLEKKFKETTRKLEEKYNIIEKMMQLSEESYYTWKICSFSEVLKKAKSGEQDMIHSAPFYRFGYKCRLRFYPNGHSGKNAYLSLYLIVMKGENDDILPWPFHKKVTFTLIDQQKDATDRENIVWFFLEDPEDPRRKGCFAKPMTDENTGYGRSQFVSHNELWRRRYIVDDTIIIQVQVSPPK